MSGRNPDDDGYLEVQLDGKQVFIILVGVVLLCGISYHFGRRAGQGEAMERLGEERAAQGLVDEALEEEDAGADLTFFDNLEEPPRSSTPPPAMNQKDSSPPPAPGREARVSSPAKPGAGSVSPSSSSSPLARDHPDSPAAEPAGVEIQVAALSERAMAESLAARLRAKGYRPRIRPSSLSGKTHYRVRVGPYPDRVAAQAAAAQLNRDFQADHIKAWVPSRGH